jgi:hypothetical protein
MSCIPEDAFKNTFDNINGGGVGAASWKKWYIWRLVFYNRPVIPFLQWPRRWQWVWNYLSLLGHVLGLCCKDEADEPLIVSRIFINYKNNNSNKSRHNSSLDRQTLDVAAIMTRMMTMMVIWGI